MNKPYQKYEIEKPFRDFHKQRKTVQFRGKHFDPDTIEHVELVDEHKMHVRYGDNRSIVFFHVGIYEFKKFVSMC